MEVAPQAKARPSARQQQPGRFPQPPRRREEFAASSRLAGAGSKIAANRASSETPVSPKGADPAQRSPRRPQQQRRSPPRRGNTSARSGATSGYSTPPSESGRLEPAEESTQEATEDLTARQPPPRKEEANSSRKAANEDKHRIDPLELARGGEVLLRRLEDFSGGNADLRRQLEQQVKEVITLQEAGAIQQQLLRDFERQAEQGRLAEKAAIEARVRAEMGDREAQLRTELEETTEAARLEREEFMARLHNMDGEFRHVEGERDEARERVRQLEERLGIAANAPEAQVERTKAMEMELSLVKSRFARETEAKKAAERVCAETQAQQKELKLCLDREIGHVKLLQKTLAEQTELANFRQEICNDMQLRLKDQKNEADKMLLREKGKQEAVSRLEGILPRQFLMKALA